MLSWKHFLRDLKGNTVKQVCLITNEVVTVANEEHMARPRSAEPKSAREERFASQSWEALRESGNPVYDIAREYADVFPDKIPAELPADRGVRHEIDLVPGYGSGRCLEIKSKLLTHSLKAAAKRVMCGRVSHHIRVQSSA